MKRARAAKGNAMKVEITVRTDKVGSNMERIIKIDDDEWNDMDDQERDEHALGIVLQNMIEWGYEEVPDERADV